MFGKTIRTTILVLSMTALAAAVAQSTATPNPAPPEGYVNVSTILPLPAFIPGIGSLYVDPANAPVGPYLSYGKNGNLIEVVYMVPLSQMNASQNWDDLPAGILKQLGASIDHVNVTFNGGHPGMAEPHYHIRLAVVSPEAEQAALAQ